MSMDKICGRMGCTANADGQVRRRNLLVWSCRECADELNLTLQER